MDSETQTKLLDLNRKFYQEFTEAFASTRSTPQKGYQLLLEYIPQTFSNVLDIGCGNGRFGKYLASVFSINYQYVGIDFTPGLLQRASEEVNGTYLQLDINQAGFLNALGKFDLVICLSTLQHIPGRANRLRFLIEVKEHLTQQGVLCIANWQFLDSPRQRRKIERWELVGITDSDVESNDYLLSWNKNGFGLRYVCFIDTEETCLLAYEAGFEIIKQFRSDGKEGNLNLYSVMSSQP